MSNNLLFDILPFDYRVDPQSKLQLPIDANDFAQQLKDQCSCGEIEIFKHDDDVTSVSLYITTNQNDPWVAATLIMSAPTQFEVEIWPKSLAVRLILWFRQYIEAHYQLFVVVLPDGEILELTSRTTRQQIEALYSDSWILSEWKGC